MQADMEMKEPEGKQLVKISRVVPNYHSRELQLVPYTVITSTPKNASTILQLLKTFQTEPKPAAEQAEENLLKREKEKPFLKRVRKDGEKIEVVVCREDSEDRGRLMGVLEETGVVNGVAVRDLPAEAPITKGQFQEWSKLWPINFVQQEITKQIPHTSQSIALLSSLLHRPSDYPSDIYLLDQKLQTPLMSTSGSCQPLTIAHPILLLLSAWSNSPEFQSHPQKYYYLTNLKLFTRKPLCGMCSMALVHSRLHSIYAGFRVEGTMNDVMGCGKLNHQVKMFYLE